MSFSKETHPPGVETKLSFSIFASSKSNSFAENRNSVFIFPKNILTREIGGKLFYLANMYFRKCGVIFLLLLLQKLFVLFVITLITLSKSEFFVNHAEINANIYSELLSGYFCK